MKTCTQCGVSKPLTNYNRDAQARDRRKAACQDCDRQRNRDYYQRHRDLVKAKNLGRYWRKQALAARKAS